MPKHSRKIDLELSMPTCVPSTKSAKHTTAGKAQSPCKLAKSSNTAAGKAGSPRTTKLAKSSNTAASKAHSQQKGAGKAQSPRKLAKSSNTAAGKAQSPCTTKLAKSSDTATGINIPASETPFGIKDVILRELIGLGKVQLVTRSSRLSRSGK